MLRFSVLSVSTHLVPFFRLFFCSLADNKSYLLHRKYISFTAHAKRSNTSSPMSNRNVSSPLKIFQRSKRQHGTPFLRFHKDITSTLYAVKSQLIDFVPNSETETSNRNYVMSFFLFERR